ncbi:MAG TPA: glucoamylase family protein [Cyclobacteriaceae bacterium]|nr:Ig-like domain-containing protein [Cyclobacteriaceae bacterium]HMV09603.1 glucoamylase family protein [Cyclobacteriaceae bacterium]HMV90603.1 glucoamylase family protein [Cyclobacteriaceae bacterium]HMX01065.1 glucoamylase family protein [Cyclobacteriaceae bacterium]HMX51764.1 glucoamylase family protein [Cyclobacteriaceae bacterium]
MILRSVSSFFLLITLLISGCGEDENSGSISLQSVFIGSTEIDPSQPMPTGLPVDQSISLTFSDALKSGSVAEGISLKKDGIEVVTNKTLSSGNKTVIIFPEGSLENATVYTIELSEALQSTNGKKLTAQSISFKTASGSLTITSVTIGDVDVTTSSRINNVSLEFSAVVNFSVPVNTTTTSSAIKLSGPGSPALQITWSNENKTATLTSLTDLEYLSKYSFSISASLKGADNQTFSAISKTLYSEIDYAPKMPLLPNDEDSDNDNTNDLLSVVQKQTFKYFYDFAHPVSGLARERNDPNSTNVVTSGGSGFGIMALIVGMERNFITRGEGLDRMDKILDFLETSDHFHGAYSHWINGNTGDVIPFSTNDNGGDLVETAYLMQGLITFRQYITNNSITNSYNIVNRINAIWEAVEWDWYRQDNQNILYWHWSPDKGWAMNHQIKGWNECLITYVLAASAPANNTIPKNVYDAGWASNGGLQNGGSYEGVTLPLGSAYGGPLFFAHYSFLGLDPRNLSDAYANYMIQNTNHSTINYKYCVRNPKSFAGYSEDCWGLTASDNQSGYNAHSPTNDLGVITPTAALSSFPYTPDESMRALKFFYYTMGDRLWGSYGFYDAFNPSENWYADSYLAIDQGPIVVMIENYRTGLLWELFMSAPEVQAGLDKLGFTY